jgi:4-hydroxythreonine-4-phosphate dehydrogenase
MIMSSNTMKVGLVTIHIPLQEVAAALTRERIVKTITAAHTALLRDFGMPKPHIAVLALNPHASDGGYIGHEEQDIILPAVKEAVAAGMNAEGPFPADGFFSAHNREMFDMVVAMYHDQGLIPFKMQAKGRGVNVTSGLPFVRTSPDHGTALDIAGRGQADPGSMMQAVRLARQLVLRRRELGG